MAKRRRTALEKWQLMPATKADVFRLDKRLRDIEQKVNIVSPPRKLFQPPEEGDDDYIP